MRVLAFATPWRSFSIPSTRRSLGVLLYNMLSGYRPFAGRSDEETCRAVQAGEFDLKVRVPSSVGPIKGSAGL